MAVTMDRVLDVLIQQITRHDYAANVSMNTIEHLLRVPEIRQALANVELPIENNKVMRELLEVNRRAEPCTEPPIKIE